MSLRARGLLLAGAALLWWLPAADASELVHRFTNPSFGGNPFNSSHLLGVASAINDYDDPKSRNASAAAGLTQGDLFARQLESRLLSGLANQVVDAIFGENPQNQGTVRFGDQVISFVRGLESIRLTIFNESSGQTTEVEVPVLQVQ